MGNAASAEDAAYGGEAGQPGFPGRTTGVTEARQAKRTTKLPPGAVKSKEEDWSNIQVRTHRRRDAPGVRVGSCRF